MDISKEELQQLVKTAVADALADFFAKQETAKAAPKAEKQTPNYQHVFDDTMAKVARGELNSKEAGEIIAKAYDQQNTAPTQQESYQELSGKLHEFKSYINGWEQQLDQWVNKSESTIEMMERMQTKVRSKEEEAKLYADMKKIQELEAATKAEASLEEMKAKLRKE